MNPKSLILLLVTAAVVTAGCATTDQSKPTGSMEMSSGITIALFKCADRNGNEYIDKSELIYLHQCGISEGLACGAVPETIGERPPKSDFDLGLRFLQVTDADGDDRISKLELRAHCNKAGFVE
jgi:hypothetical protein